MEIGEREGDGGCEGGKEEEGRVREEVRQEEKGRGRGVMTLS